MVDIVNAVDVNRESELNRALELGHLWRSKQSEGKPALGRHWPVSVLAILLRPLCEIHSPSVALRQCVAVQIAERIASIRTTAVRVEYGAARVGCGIRAAADCLLPTRLGSKSGER